MADPQLTVMIPAEVIQDRVRKLAIEISEDLQGEPITLLGVMTGSLMFLTDFMRALEVPHQVGVIQASSYCGESTTSGQLTVNLDFLPPLSGRNVLLIDDILDTGQTLQRLTEKIETLNPASLRTAVLLWKQCRTTFAIEPDYFGFKIEDHFVVGYGLDYNDDYRHLADICELRLG